MAGLTETPRGNRLRIAFFGLRNAGKSTLANAFAGQDLAIVSAAPGTTTDPVSKAMEIPPLGPCLVTDTAGLDDVGALGEARVKRTLAVLEATDVAVWVAADADENPWKDRFLAACAARKIPVVDYRRGEDIDAFRARLVAAAPAADDPGLLDGFVSAGDRVVCVCPLDAAAPKGRLILPQVQVLRAALDAHATCTVCQPEELAALLDRPCDLVITDSQAFPRVREILRAASFAGAFTSFSILFARQKGDLAVFVAGLDALKRLKDGDRVLVAEGCTHHRQCGDIGREKIPAALRRLTGKTLEFAFASGPSWSEDFARVALVVHCGGCMLSRREMLGRLRAAGVAGVPVVNYGLLLATAAGLAGLSSDGRVTAV